MCSEASFVQQTKSMHAAYCASLNNKVAGALLSVIRRGGGLWTNWGAYLVDGLD